MQMVKESLNEGYCDISGHPTDMTLVGEYLVIVTSQVTKLTHRLGEMGGIKVFVAKGLSHRSIVVECSALTVTL